MDSLVERLAVYRLEKHHTQTRLAKMLGVTFQTVNRWLNGHMKPNKLQTYQIVKLLMGESVQQGHNNAWIKDKSLFQIGNGHPWKQRPPALQPYVSKGAIKTRTTLRGIYRGKSHYASIQKDGCIRYRGSLFNSPSSAAAAISGSPTSGWDFWEIRRRGRWLPLASLRTRHARNVS